MTHQDFWARRKAAVQAEADADLRAAEGAEIAARDAELEQKSDEELLQDLGLPDPDSLGEGDDFKVFLAKTVPARIRSRALRRLWLTNPVLANVDGLVDYGEDFTDGAKVLEAMQTAYQVGKGMTAHVEEMARQAEAEAAAEQDAEQPAETDADPDAPAALTENAPAPDQLTLTGAAPDPAPTAAPDVTTDEDDETAPLPPRRMRFAFDDAQART